MTPALQRPRAEVRPHRADSMAEGGAVRCSLASSSRYLPRTERVDNHRRHVRMLAIAVVRYKFGSKPRLSRLVRLSAGCLFACIHVKVERLLGGCPLRYGGRAVHDAMRGSPVSPPYIYHGGRASGGFMSGDVKLRSLVACGCSSPHPGCSTMAAGNAPVSERTAIFIHAFIYTAVRHRIAAMDEKGGLWQPL
jgi:hypothetical protein